MVCKKITTLHPNGQGVWNFDIVLLVLQHFCVAQLPHTRTARRHVFYDAYSPGFDQNPVHIIRYF